MLLAGLVDTFAMKDIGGIPSLWEKFNAWHAHIPKAVERAAYGVSLSFSEETGCDYMCGVEVSDASDLPRELTSRTIAAATYAVFRQPGHITLIRPTIGTIWTKWLPQSGYSAAEAPLIEYYGPGFDPKSGTGGFEVWLPGRRKAALLSWCRAAAKQMTATIWSDGQTMCNCLDGMGTARPNWWL
eukprot:gene228-331_t